MKVLIERVRIHSRSLRKLFSLALSTFLYLFNSALAVQPRTARHTTSTVTKQ